MTFASGSVISYPYLWKWQYEQGRDHGEKDRPVCLALSLVDSRTGDTHLVLLPVSSKPPQPDQIALEVPPLELRRAGLSKFPKGWITVSEYNYDIAERSFHLDLGQAALGSFSPAFLERVRQAFRPTLARGSSRVDRTS